VLILRVIRVHTAAIQRGLVRVCFEQPCFLYQNFEDKSCRVLAGACHVAAPVGWLRVERTERGCRESGRTV